MLPVIHKLNSLIRFSKELWGAVRTNGYEEEICRMKPPLSQLLEMLQLRMGPGKIIPEDYYRYTLYDDSKFNPREKRKFMSQEAVPDNLCKTSWNLLGNDKLLFYSLLNGFNAPLPHTFALFHHYRNAGKLRVLRTAEDLKHYLLNEVSYPFVLKPVDGIYSQDVRIIQTLLPDDDRCILGDGSTMAIDTLIRSIVSLGERGVLFQELLQPHPFIEQICGPRLCSIRMIILVSPQGSELLHGLWKIAIGKNMADNYWRGNLLARVNPDSGVVESCISGMGRNLTFHETHPDTGKSLLGFVLPDWEAAKQECLKLSSCLSGIPIQAWDVALTNEGPKFLEVNIVGSLFLPQLARQEGFLDDKVRTFFQNFSQNPQLKKSPM